ncbi:MAG TPA: N-acetyltransferase [Cyanobacteria bacterium UBA11149]|nr:N-acetyltransferase [Cyanobacteria bacterium UBA11366]HBR72255.1 N-acetyltransferase [Cyanobacteria bacterium UBA11159]HBS68427.1 N-acetyltransferase [Cyanobacteria bacterium UBA11153]HBW91913.1 N-acetyltransferase [Cyanobacteria bacterium UBA11149]HCA94484.1 N-acetyltransferase [Cyanobacteria bacterium UBA9226]
MDLIAINIDGKPQKPIILSEIAQSVCNTTAAMYQLTGFVPPWIGYLTRKDGELVGTCAFKTPPQNGRVEIAYFTFPDYEGKGIATNMALHLIEIARQNAEGIIVFAQTLPEENASTAILKKLGFQLIEEVIHPEDGRVWEWEILP